VSHTVDSICRGELVLRQPRRGYRFNVDSVILAGFCTRVIHTPPVEAADLGAGCGVVGLLLARRWRSCRVRLVEIQRELADLARANISDNGLDDRVSLVQADLRRPEDWLGPVEPELVVSNPPFFKRGAGKISQDRQVAVAKHEVRCSLQELFAACAAALSQGGAAAVIHAAERRDDLLDQLRRRGLEPTHLRMVRPLPDRKPTRVLVLARAAASGAHDELPELLVEQRPGVYSEEMAGMLEGEGPKRS